ncbi:MAG: hypothetical protein IKV45_03300 [Firmicutes bacterium]|nr:hypothetical protein [Bacillota bacterium]
MKKKSGCFSRILAILMILGIVGAAGLGCLGYQKANEAEANKTPTEELRSAYIGDAPIQGENEVLENFLTELVGDNEVVRDITAALGNSTMADMITEGYYLPDDDTVSTAIAQKILSYRLTKAYSNEELLVIYGGIMDYAPATIESSTPHLDRDFLQDLLSYLTEQGILKEETANEIKTYIK